MSRMPRIYPPIAILIIILLAGCNLPSQGQPTTSPDYTPVADLQQTMLTFRVSLPQAIPAGDSVYITLLDEVTGLAFNPHRYIMRAEDALHYSVSLPFYLGKVIKYRYTRQGAATVDEHLFNDRPVRYRLVHVEGPGTVDDVLCGWTDLPYTGPTGRIVGSVIDAVLKEPLPDILVAGGGAQAFTQADGTFVLEGLAPGTHNLVFLPMDGLYPVYQQGAEVAANSTTPVAVSLTPANTVTVIFTVKVPAGTPADAPLRMAGSLSQLGNTFGDLAGGVSSLASRMPVLGKLPDGRYMVTLRLAAGTYLEYKYTLGDGLWSAEVTPEGAARLHQLIVPDKGLELGVSDSVEAWSTPGTQPLRFEVSVPADTPKAESVSIQFNPGFGWLEPVPMWSGIDGQGQPVWRFDLTGPFNNMASLHYRYCRQGQCGVADDSATIGLYPEGRVVNPSANPGTVKDEVLSWAWYSGPFSPPNVPGVQVNPRGGGFTAGIALQPAYHPSWGPLMPAAVQDIQALGANPIVLSPTWTFTNNTPPQLEPQPAQDMLYSDLRSTIQSAQAAKLRINLYPQVHFPTTADQWWQAASRDYTWWTAFFDNYSNFILQHASVASYYGINSLIMGGDWLGPALPGGLLVDGNSSGVPQDAESMWRSLIDRVRQRYPGRLAWVISYPEGIQNPPPFLDAMDEVYIQWSVPLASQPGATPEEMQAQAAAILDHDIQPFQQQVGKNIILAISYPSIDRGATGCITIQGGGCLDYGLLSPPNTDITALTLDMQVQTDAYNAMLTAINDRPWIAGYVSMGYYPPAIMQDKSISIHGKPASGVLWYWSTKYLGK